MVADAPYLGDQADVIGYDHSAVAHRAEVLARVEAEAGGVTDLANSDPVPLGEVGLSRVLENQQASTSPLLEVARWNDVSVQMDGDHSARSGRRTPGPPCRA